MINMRVRLMRVLCMNLYSLPGLISRSAVTVDIPTYRTCYINCEKNVHTVLAFAAVKCEYVHHVLDVLTVLTYQL